MGYQVMMTKAGFALQAKLFAEGGDLELTKVEVGSGVLPEGTGWREVSALVEPRAAATSTKPVRRDCAVDLTIEYRADLNGGLEEAFQIREFGVFAIGVDGAEALILYGDLSDYPESAVPQRYGGCVRRYPVHMEIGPNTKVTLDYPPGAWLSAQDLEDGLAAHNVDEHSHMDIRRLALGSMQPGDAYTKAESDALRAQAVSTHNADTNAHPFILKQISDLDGRLGLLELKYGTSVSGNSFNVTFADLAGLVVTGVWNEALARIEF